MLDLGLAVLVLAAAVVSVVVLALSIPSWGRMRRAGVTAGAYAWICGLFYAAMVIDGPAALVGLWLGWPIWIDLLLLLGLAGCVMVLAATLAGRDTFNRAVFGAVVVASLCLPGLGLGAKVVRHLGADLTRAATSRVVAREADEAGRPAPALVTGVPAADAPNAAVVRTADEAVSAPAKALRAVVPYVPKLRMTAAGPILQAKPGTFGSFGESVTIPYITGPYVDGRRFAKIPSKMHLAAGGAVSGEGRHGIDGLFLKRDGHGRLTDVLIAETKTYATTTMARNARFPHPTVNPNQMKDAWVVKRVDGLVALRRLTAEEGDLVKRGLALASGAGLAPTAGGASDLTRTPPKVTKELWVHDLEAGRTTVSRLDADAGVVARRTVDTKLERRLREACAREKFVCGEAAVARVGAPPAPTPAPAFVAAIR